MAQTPDVSDQIAQLNAARSLVLGDSAFYPQIVNGILPIVGANTRLELRRWGANFLAETFASPVLAVEQKEQLAPSVLQTIREILELPETDIAVLQSLVQTSASLYPLVFRHIVNHPQDSKSWENMCEIKQEILRKMDDFPCSVKLCCAKFIQRVVQVQTHSSGGDPRRPELNETSLAIVPRSHALLSIPNLEAESSGLLDRLLGVFQEDTSDPLLVNATINLLPPLIRTRPTIAHKIVNAVLDFIPAHHVRPPFTPTVRVSVKSMERTARALFWNILKKNQNHPLAPRMHAYIERLSQSRLEATDDSSRKRNLPNEPTDGLDNAKRARLDAMPPPTMKIPPMAPGPASFDRLFTLTEDSGLSSFDVQQLPFDIVLKIVVPLLSQVHDSTMTQAVEAVRNRYQAISREQILQRQQQQSAAPDEDDDYEPEYQPMDAASVVSEENSAVAEELADLQPDLVSLGPFVLPQPPPLSEEEAGEIGRSAVARVFGMLNASETSPAPAKSQTQQKLGFARLAGSTFDRDAWSVLLARLATRAPAGLVDGPQAKGDSAARRQTTIADSIRETLYRYILEDFRGRLNIAIIWLNEEYYNDRMQMRSAAAQRDDSEEESEPTVALNYDTWSTRLLDGFLAYLDGRDIKVLVRFLSEVPEITIAITQRVASLAKDPERVNLCVQSLMYLIMFRPPARDMCLNTVEDVYQTYEESRPAATKILTKWRPESTVLEKTTNDAPEPSVTPVQPEAQPTVAADP